ncbi:MAG: hypothetical protein L6Q76_02640 [Polyangiaceae bacterium]|nr:hypothetical protein [Polyangiaceae bacterium]
MTIDMRLVTKGRSEPLDGLLEQGKVHVALAKQYAAALIESGWSEEDTSALELEVSRLQAMAGEAGAASASAAEEPSAIVEAKAFVRRLRNALPRALRETKAQGVSEAVFDAGGKLGREAKGIAAYLEKIRPSVAVLDGELRRHFGGKSASELLDQAKGAVERAGQAAPQGEVPHETLKLFAVKGRVLEMIEDLNRAGRIAFEGQAETVGKFNKDVLLRARRSKGAGAAAQAS